MRSQLIGLKLSNVVLETVNPIIAHGDWGVYEINNSRIAVTRLGNQFSSGIITMGGNTIISLNKVEITATYSQSTRGGIITAIDAYLVTINDCNLTGNGVYGGVIFVKNTPIVIKDSIMSGTAIAGTAIYAINSDITLENSLLESSFKHFNLMNWLMKAVHPCMH